VGSFLPFQITYYLNGHHDIERELLRRHIEFRKNDNAFLAVADPEALQAAADRLSAEIISKRLDYWTWLVGQKFSGSAREFVETANWRRLEPFALPGMAGLRIPALHGRSEAVTC
jgi:hypothetical protein